METTEETTKKQKKSASSSNGKSKVAEKSTQPVDVQLDREDLLSLQLWLEKGRRLDAEELRIKAEQRVLQQENILYVQALNEKYGIDMNGYTIDIDDGVAKPKAQ